MQLPLPVALGVAAPKTGTSNPGAAGRRLAQPKPLPTIRLDAVADPRAEPLALFELSDMVRRWSCAYCPGVIREDGIAIHHYECRYWQDNPTETPF